MSATYSIVELKAENVKRLKAVHIKPDGSLITVGGKNAAGKSSVLDSIAYALGGSALVPEEPIRRGEDQAKVELDLGAFVVTRTFRREQVPTDVPNSWVWGPTRSTLTVRNKDGAVYPSPQAMLDKLLGSLTFDPLEFARAKPKEQLETLRRLTNLDTTVLDEQRKAAYDRRAVIKKQIQAAKHRLDEMPGNIQDDTERVSIADLVAELSKAEELRKVADEAARAEQEAQRRTFDLAKIAGGLEGIIEKLERELDEYRKKLSIIKTQQFDADLAFHAAQKTSMEALAAVPDTAETRQQLKDADEHNKQVDRNDAKRQAWGEHVRLVEQAEDESLTIYAVDLRKNELIASVKFPVDGLGFREDGVLFNGLPFEQASTSEQLRISVAIGMALNSQLRVLLVRNGECLDSESRLFLAQLAEESGVQLWMERMTESNEGVTVMIEDGQVK